MKKNTKNAAAVAAPANTAIAVASTSTIAPFASIMMDLDLDLIDRNPLNRDNFSEEGLAELGESIRQHGLQTEIQVRPLAEGRYQIVFGERRWRASKMAGLTTIRAKIKEMTDEQAEICAVIENMQRENYTPFEEAQIFRRMSEERSMSVAQICEAFAKKEDYVRSRLSLLKLIPEVVELLKRKDISLEIAKEFANYSDTIQKEVHDQHFRGEGFYSWKGLPAKEFAKRLYDQYMTKLDTYTFDKTECQTCGHNTFNQVLFTACGDCAGCQNMECLQKKNTDHMVNLAVELSTKDPRLHMAAFSDGNTGVIARLTELGHEVLTLDKPSWHYDEAPDMPEQPKAEDYDDADDLQFAMDDYQGEMEDFKKDTAEIEFAVSEGKMLKYAVIGKTSIDLFYEQAEEEQVVQNGVTRTITPESPAKELHKKDERNAEICYEHVTKDLKKVLKCTAAEFPKTEITPREEQLLCYVMLDRISYEHKNMLGIESAYSDDAERLQVAENLTPEQKTMLARMAIMRYCNDMNENYVKPESTDVKVITEFADLHFSEQSKAVQERHKKTFDTRHQNLETRIKAIENEAELQRLREAATEGQTAEVNGLMIDLSTGEVVDVEQTEPEPCDYPQPGTPQEPAQDMPRIEEDPAEFIPEEPLSLSEVTQPAGKGKKKRAAAETDRMAA